MSSDEPALFARQYEALTIGQAVVDLTGWSHVTVRGADRHTFLHNFCTGDVKLLVPGASCEAFFTNVKGKIVGHGLIGCRDDELAIVGAPGQAERLVPHLDRYVIREDVQLTDDTADRAIVLVVCDDNSYTDGIAWDIVGRKSSRVLDLPLNEAEAARKKSCEQGLILAGWRAFDVARIEAGFPLFGVDFGEENLPQEVGRDSQAISFTKGCYLGQETVARIDALGHVNQKLVSIRFAGPDVPPAGTELMKGGREVGLVTSAAFSPKWGAPLGLAMVRRDASAPGTRLESAAGAGEVVAL